MLSFTVCWVIPREWRGWKTSRFRPLAEEITHIYIFLSSLQAQSSNVGDRQLVSWSPSLCRLLLHASARLRTQGERAPTTCAGFGSTVWCPRHPGSRLRPQIPLRGGHGAPPTALPSSPPPIPCPSAPGQALGPAGTSGATRNGTSVPIKTHHYVKIHIEIWIDRLDKNGS